MKKDYKIFIPKLIIILASLLFVGLAPVQAIASRNARWDLVASTDDSSKTIARLAAVSTNSFCVSLPSLASSIDSELNFRVKAALSMQTTTSQDYNNKSDQRLKKLVSDREQWDKNREQHYDSLYKKAKNDNQKIAIDSFRGRLEAAISLRRSNQDRDTLSYEEAIKANLFQKNSSLYNQVAKYKTILDGATLQAVKDCSTAEGQSISRPELISTIDKAQFELRSGNSGYKTVNDQILSLSKQRKDKINAASQDFEQEINRAKNDLKEALK